MVKKQKNPQDFVDRVALITVSQMSDSRKLNLKNEKMSLLLGNARFFYFGL